MIIQGSSCVWSEHIIRSALPGKPNLRSKLCQVSNDDDDDDDGDDDGDGDNYDYVK